MCFVFMDIFRYLYRECWQVMFSNEQDFVYVAERKKTDTIVTQPLYQEAEKKDREDWLGIGIDWEIVK